MAHFFKALSLTHGIVNGRLGRVVIEIIGIEVEHHHSAVVSLVYPGKKTI